LTIQNDHYSALLVPYMMKESQVRAQPGGVTRWYLSEVEKQV
jgi:hypothetical protein